MGWQIEVLEGVAATATEIGSGIYNVLSSTPLNAFLVDNATLEALKQISGTEIAPIVNDLGETIGYMGKAAASSNGSTAVSNTLVTITREAQTVTQELIDAAIPLVGGGTTADLQVGQEITKAGLAAGAGVGGAAGTGVGTTALSTVAGPAIAVALGVGAGVALYDIAPEFWTDVSNSLMAAGKTIDGKVLSFFKSDGTEYYDEQVISIIREALINSNYLSTEGVTEYTPPDDFVLTGVDVPIPVTAGACHIDDTRSDVYDANVISDIDVHFAVGIISGVYAVIIMASENPNKTMTLTVQYGNTVRTYTNNSYYTYNDKTVWYTTVSWNLQFGPAFESIPPTCGNLYSFGNWNQLAWSIVYGTVDGLSPSPNELPQEQNDDDPNSPIATVSPVPTGVTDPIQNPIQDPNRKPSDSYDPDPTTDPTPDDNPSPDVDPNPQPDPDPAPDPNPTPPTAPVDPIDPNPPGDNSDNGDPEITPVPASMAGNALSKVFNPTQSETDALGQYLWSSTNLEDILKLFQSPLDGIIAFMKLYATPTTGSHQNIKLGYLDSGVSAAVVTQQIATIDCGSITIPGDKANATDYPPYTTMQIYLPFIGIQPLNAYDLIGSQLAVRYRVDCYTGACIAQLKVTRDNLSSVLYEFAGNCAQQIPLTSGNFLQLAGNTIQGFVTGAVHGGLVGAAIGAGSSLIHSNVEVGRSGNLSANAGMLGCRVPYVIITRAVSADAANYRDFYGYPANKTVYLKNCSGYTRVKDIILHTSATQAERNEIEQLLKTGIII